MDQQFNLNRIRSIVRRFWKHKWMILVPGVLACAVATAYAVRQPDIYRGKTMLIAEFSNPSGGAVRKSELDRTREILNQVSERIYSTDFLLPMMEKLDLHPDLRKAATPDRAVVATREDLSVSFNGMRQYVEITYDYDKGKNPAQTAASAANYVADYLVTRARDSIADDALMLRDFYRKEVENAKKQVDKCRQELIVFRTDHDGDLPDNRSSNEGIVNRESQTVNFIVLKKDSLDLEIKHLEGELDLAQARLLNARIDSGADEELQPRRTELAALRSEYIRAERKYTPTSSQLRILRERIQDLEKEVARLEKAGIENAADDDLMVQSARNSVTQLKARLERTIAERSKIDEMVAEAKKKMTLAQQRIERSFELEPAYQSLKEAQDQAEKRLERARTSLESSELTLRFHSEARDFVLHINERARANEKPVGPQRLILALGGLAGGLAFGLGLAFLRVGVDVTFRSREEIRPLLPSAILVSIPDVESVAKRTWRLSRDVALAAGILLVLACTIGLLGLREGWWGDPSLLDTIVAGIKGRIGAL